MKALGRLRLLGMTQLRKEFHAVVYLEFEDWAVIALGGIPNKVQVGDMGVDGRIFTEMTKACRGIFAHCSPASPKSY